MVTHYLDISPSRHLTERRLHRRCNCQRCLGEFVFATQNVGRTWAILNRTTWDRKIDYLLITEASQTPHRYDAIGYVDMEEFTFVTI